MFLILILPMVMVSQENESFLLNLTEITVKYGHNAQFIEGVKSWKKCYMDNEGKDNWSVWKRVQGEGSVFTITSRMANWAEMDEEGDAAGKACRMNVVNSIRPHVKSIHYNVARSMPDLSRSGLPEGTEMVWVYNVKVNNSQNFKDVVGEITKAVKNVEGDPRGIWYNTVGGAPEVSDYFVAVPFKNFADLDNNRDGVWKIHENANGKKETEALRTKFRASISDDWSYMYKLMKELSN